MTEVKFTVLVENCAFVPGLKAEQGWSMHVATGHGNILFDTGRSGQVLENAKALNIDLRKSAP